MQDDNGNGIPDDTWYELRGSETGLASTVSDHAVTYYRPSAAGMPVQWKDNIGNKGEINYLVEKASSKLKLDDYLKEPLDRINKLYEQLYD